MIENAELVKAMPDGHRTKPLDLDVIRAAETRAKKIRQLAPEQRSEGDAALLALLAEIERLRESLEEAHRTKEPSECARAEEA